MTLIVETGAGITSANSYISIADADAYLLEHGSPSAWSGVAARGQLTLVTNPSDTDTLTIGTKVYIFQSTLTNVDGNIEIGTLLSDTVTNITNAINLEGTPGTGYAAAMTEHDLVSAHEAGLGTIVIIADSAGTAGNSYATTETFTHADNVFDAATMGTLLAGIQGELDVDKENHLIRATNYLDNRYKTRFLGTRVSATQPLQWPRCGVWTPDGYAVEEDEIPQGLIDSNVLMAVRFAQDVDPLPDDTSGGTLTKTFKKIGDLAILNEWQGGNAELRRFIEVDMLLRPITRHGSPVERG